MEHLDFKNKLCILYGATGGLGSALAKELHQRGASLGLIGRNLDKLLQLRVQLGSERVSVLEVTHLQQQQALVQAWLNQLGPWQIGIHASGMGRFQTARQMSEEDFEEVVQTNLLSAFAFYKQLDQAAKAPQWDLAFLGSASLEQAWPKNTAYGASKAGLAYFAKSLEKEVAPQGGRVFLFELGSVWTPFFDKAPHHLPKEKMIQAPQAARFIADQLCLPAGLYSSPMRLLSVVS